MICYNRFKHRHLEQGYLNIILKICHQIDIFHQFVSFLKLIFFQSASGQNIKCCHHWANLKKKYSFWNYKSPLESQKQPKLDFINFQIMNILQFEADNFKCLCICMNHKCALFCWFPFKNLIDLFSASPRVWRAILEGTWLVRHLQVNSH